MLIAQWSDQQHGQVRRSPSQQSRTVWYDPGDPTTVWYDLDEPAFDLSPTSATEEVLDVTSDCMESE